MVLRVSPLQQAEDLGIKRSHSGARASANPESRNRGAAALWIPGSPLRDAPE
jgi:hypothetical protein